MSMEKTVDRDLVVRARAGNRDAFGSLIDRYQVIAKSIALRMIANEDIAREMVQEAVLQALLSLHRLRDNGRFKNWFFGIVINVCRVYLRQQESGYLSLESLEALDSWPVLSHDGDRSTDPQDLVEARELHGLMLSAIEDLSAANRDAVILFYYRHLSLQEIAEALDVTTGSVKVRLHRARKQLRDQLLKIYPEIDLYISADQRSKTMIPVRIADLVRLGGRNIVLLLDDTGQRVLPIWIG